MHKRTFLLGIGLLTSTAALAASSDPKRLDRNSAVCRDLRPYLEAAKRVASNDPEAFSLFLRARRNAFECYTQLEGWPVP